MANWGLFSMSLSKARVFGHASPRRWWPVWDNVTRSLRYAYSQPQLARLSRFFSTTTEEEGDISGREEKLPNQEEDDGPPEDDSG